MPESYGYSDEWADVLRRLVKAEMAKRGVTYEQLAEKLATLGIEKTPSNLSTRINSGAFGAQLLLEILAAMGCRSLDLSLIHEELDAGKLRRV